GTVNPTWSTTRQEALKGCPPELPGRLLEPWSNPGPRWMAARPDAVKSRARQNPAYRPTHPSCTMPLLIGPYQELHVRLAQRARGVVAGRDLWAHGLVVLARSLLAVRHANGVADLVGHDGPQVEFRAGARDGSEHPRASAVVDPDIGLCDLLQSSVGG